ncbi:cytochrome b [Tanticharoenia sakaeratensis]|uniref:Cytochrome protein n=1 Tax=Tanticharoenia sakaeratensis NBRC 103193 TaxID=1231623 RepID=A0A0D6MGJ9_9PROT|nr:cytochrome b [Tanticharoenia sakaeratensis]GAN52749.1 cytochrome protein [Tanticharoenia sakaeratensis NBRC 103193]GBQ17906.1 cytochrome B561 [Tanticharoenia sakaeratensis NBRC 103193]
MRTNRTPTRFSGIARLLHWFMAAMILCMLFLGVFMAGTVGPAYATSVAIHRPVGIAILALALIRLVNRLIVPQPALPASLPRAQALAAKASHVLLYTLMIAMPLIGWGMLSAGAYPVVMWGGVHLPPILPHDTALFAGLRRAHTVLACTLFATILVHIAAALLHGLILRDGVFPAMASLGSRHRA